MSNIGIVFCDGFTGPHFTYLTVPSEATLVPSGCWKRFCKSGVEILYGLMAKVLEARTCAFSGLWMALVMIVGCV